MTERITAAMVKGAFAAMTSRAERIGLDTRQWRLEEGEPSVGYNWALMKVGDGSRLGLTGKGGGSASLGSTKREAYEALVYMKAAFHLAASVDDIRQTTCRLCGHDIEGYVNRREPTWRDSGMSVYCLPYRNRRQVAIMPPEGQLHEPTT